MRFSSANVSIRVFLKHIFIDGFDDGYNTLTINLSLHYTMRLNA